MMRTGPPSSIDERRPIERARTWRALLAFALAPALTALVGVLTMTRSTAIIVTVDELPNMPSTAGRRPRRRAMQLAMWTLRRPCPAIQWVGR